MTTIAQPLYDLGAISMRMLTKIMHKEELEEREVLLPHGLTERRSTRKRNRKKSGNREDFLICFLEKRFILPYSLSKLVLLVQH